MVIQLGWDRLTDRHIAYLILFLNDPLDDIEIMILNIDIEYIIRIIIIYFSNILNAANIIWTYVSNRCDCAL